MTTAKKPRKKRDPIQPRYREEDLPAPKDAARIEAMVEADAISQGFVKVKP